MSQYYLGEIRAAAFNYAPQDWAFCDGSVIKISDNDALFNLIGTTYGGDGVNTFCLPDLRGRVPVGQGAGPGLTPRKAGQQFGTEGVSLDSKTTPAHNHLFLSSNAAATTTNPTGNVLAAIGSSTLPFYSDGSATGSFAPGVVGMTGGSLPHENRQPLQVQNFIICVAGVYPS